MLKKWREQRAVRKIKPGDGRALKPFRWWNWMGRALFHLDLPSSEKTHTYSIDVDYVPGLWRRLEAHLYKNGRQHSTSKLPASFSVEDGTIQVAMGVMGLKECHYYSNDGASRQLSPHPSSPEGHRYHLDQAYPRVSKTIGVASLATLVIALLMGIPQLAEQLTQLDLLKQFTGVYVSPLQLPPWVNTALLFAGLAATAERALRLRYNQLLDGGMEFEL